MARNMRSDRLEELSPLREPDVYDWNILTKLYNTGNNQSKAISIDCIRHAETVYNQKKLISGQTDIRLSPFGRVRALGLNKVIRDDYDFIYCSSLGRAYETMELALQDKPNLLRKAIVDPRINECSFGILEGTKMHLIAAYSSGNVDFTPENGESYRQLIQRCASFLVDLHATCSNSEGASNVLVFTHMGPMRVFEAMFHNIKDPKEMFGFSFRNLLVRHYDWNSVSLPRFIAK